ncbi:transglycosylase SLT domain-containing protein [Streptomyces sp. E11-3]|uniref:transglycosylase SLT domain-containing protein n=1 Tax=Streptomyces sp. E11-3 TaxID=3110112 RepID=UPI00397EE74B
MSKRSIPGHKSLTKSQKFSVAGVAALGAAALAFSFTPGSAEAEQVATSEVAGAPVAWTAAEKAQAAVTKQQAAADKLATVAVDAAKQKAEQEAKAKAEQAAKEKAAKEKAEREAKAKAEAEAKAKAEREKKEAASRAAERKPVYANNLDGWIRQSLAIMKSKGIPGSYDGIHRNVIRESGGNPRAINDWDINAQNGTPSIGLLQVIQPTFNAYHVAGTPHDLYNPVSNIVAACNYAADRYGSIDNVNGAY